MDIKMEIKQEPQSLIEKFVTEKNGEFKQSDVSDVCIQNDLKEEMQNEVQRGSLKKETTVELIAYLPTKSPRAYGEALPNNVSMPSTSISDVALECWNEVRGDVDTTDISSINTEELMMQDVTRDTFMKLHRRQNGQPVMKKKCLTYSTGLHFLIGNKYSSMERNDSENTEMDATIHERENYCAGATLPEINPRKRHHSTHTARKKCSPGSLLETAQTLTNVITQDLQFQKAQKNGDKYGNKTFLLSFAPLMDRLPPHLYLHARMKISQVFQELLPTETFT